MDLPDGPIRQVTDGPRLNSEQEVAEHVLTLDGEHLVFTSRSSFDPQADTMGLSQIFVYDDEAGDLQQVTGRPGLPSSCSSPAADAAANTIACWGGAASGYGLYVIKRDTGTAEQVLDTGPIASSPLALTEDGNLLLFSMSADLDPSVTNEDLNYELFILDLRTRKVTQVSDTFGSFGISQGGKIDAFGNVALARVLGALNETKQSPPILRFVRRRSGTNEAPTLTIGRTLVAAVGEQSHLPLKATDADSDPLIFHAEKIPPFPNRIGELSGYELADYGDGTALLQFSPTREEVGNYDLRVAVFDDAGGVATSDVRLLIRSFACPGDCDGDGVVSVAELVIGVRVALGVDPLSSCYSLDLNEPDGHVDISEIVAAADASLHGCARPGEE